MPRPARIAAVACLSFVPMALLRCVASIGCDSCDSGLAVELGRMGAWAPGDYVVSVGYEGATHTCAVKLPLTGSSATGRLQCSEWVYLDLYANDAGASTGLTQVEIWAAPAAATITVSQGGNVLATGTLTPTYTSRPSGGAACTPCKFGSDRLSIP